MGPTLSYTTGEWHVFVGGVKYGDFDELAERSESPSALTAVTESRLDSGRHLQPLDLTEPSPAFPAVRTKGSQPLRSCV